MSALEQMPANQPRCSDCDCIVTWQGWEAIARGSSVREPGEPLCGSCSAKRSKMVRELNDIPDSLDQIRANKRWVR